MQSLFGVTADESARTGYKTYTPGGGLRDVNYQFGVMTSLGTQTMLTIGLNSRSLFGDGRDSPLTRQKTSTGAFAMLMSKL
jgi:MipA family protein